MAHATAFLTGKQPILTGVLFLFLIPITKLYSSIWTQSARTPPIRTFTQLVVGLFPQVNLSESRAGIGVR